MKKIKELWCKWFHEYLLMPNEDWSKMVCPCGVEYELPDGVEKPLSKKSK